MKSTAKFLTLALSVMTLSTLAGGTTYYSTGSVAPHTTTNWKTNPDGSGTSPANFTSGDIFVVQNGHTMTTTNAWTVSGAGAEIQIENGGVLRFDNNVITQRLTVQSGGELYRISNSVTINNGNAGGYDFSVAGTYRHTGSGTGGGISYGGSATGEFQSGSKYIHQRDGGGIPSATWNSNSICEITGIVNSSFGSGDDQAFGKFVWNCSGQGGNSVNLGVSGLSMGSFEMKNSGTSGEARLNIGSLQITGNYTHTGGIFRIAAASNDRSVTVGGDFSLSSGTLLINDGAGASTGTLNVAGNISHTGGTISENNSNASAKGAIVLNGSGAQSLTSTGSFNGTITWEINKSSGAVNLGDNFSLPSGHTLTFTAGNMVLGSYNLMLGGTISGAGAGKCIVATGSGKLQKPFTTASSFIYPIGDGTNYTPATLNFTSGTFTSAYAGVNLQASKHQNNNSGTDFINRFWTVTQSGISGFSCDVTFEYVDGDIDGNEASMVGGKWDGSWTVLGPVNGALNQITGTVTSFSDFTAGQEAGLPIQLSSFTSTILEAGGVRLDWQTISEINNYGFFIERRAEHEKLFTELPGVFIPGHGTTLEPQSYSYTDNSATPGVWYYRLRQVDLDGSVNYTDAVRAELVVTAVAETAPLQFVLTQNYPNPFNPSTEIKFSVEATGQATLDVYNLLGQKVASLFSGVAEAGKYYRVQFDAAKMASGIYLYRLQSAAKSDLKRMVLVR